MTQGLLDFAPPSSPQPPLNSSAPRERAPHFRACHWAILRALLEAEAAGRPEVRAAALMALRTADGRVIGHRLAARIAECRAHLAPEWRPRRDQPGGPADPIPCRTDRRTGAAWYRLAPWAADAARRMQLR